MSVGLLSLISSIMLMLLLFLVGTFLAVMLPKGEKTWSLIFFGLSLIVGSTLVLMSWGLYRAGF